MSKFYRVWNQKSIFSRYLISFFLVLIIPLSCSIASFIITYNMMLKEIHISNSTSLNQFSYTMNERFSNINDLMLSIETMDSFLELVSQDRLNKELDPYLTYNCYKALSSKKNSYSQDIFIYFENSNKIITQNTTGSADEIYLLGYSPTLSPTEDQLQAWHNKLSTKTKSLSITNIYKKSEKYIALQMTLPLELAKTSTVTATYVMQTPNIHKEFKDAGILLFSKDGEKLFSTSSEFDFLDLSTYDGQTSFFNYKSNEDSYMIKVKPSSVLDCYFVSAIPMKVFKQKLIKFGFVQIIFIILYMALGIFLSYLLDKRNYKPILQAIQDIRLKASDFKIDTDAESDIHFITRTIDELVKIRNDFATRLKKNSNAIKTNLLSNLLNGLFPANTDISARLKSANITFSSSRFCILKLALQTKNDVTKELIKICNTNHCIRLTKNEYSCILAVKNNEYIDDVKIETKKLCDNIRNELNTSCAMGMSSILQGYLGISIAYKQADAALEHKMYNGANCFISFEDIVASNIHIPKNFHLSTVEKIRIALGTDKDLKIVIDYIIKEYFKDTSHSPNDVRYFMYEITAAINDVAENKSYFDSSNNITTLTKCETLDIFKQELLELLAIMRKNFNSHNNQQTFSDKIITYIDQNYNDPNLDLNSLGKQFNLTPSYLSKLFKEETKERLTQYILNKRMEMAKILLSTTDKTNVQISNEIGILDSSRFIKLFKKFYGVTPGTFRKTSTL